MSRSHPDLSQNLAGRLDHAALKDIARLMGAEKFTRLINVFFENSWQCIERIRVLAEHENPAEIQPDVHSLKGSSANIGASYLSGLCRETEKLLTTTPCDFSRVTTLVNEIEAELTRIRPLLPAFSDD